MGKDILAYVIIGVLGFIGWLLKASIYGRLDKMEQKGNEELEKLHQRIDKIRGEYQPVQVCVATRTGCQNLLISKIDGLSDKIETILDNQTHLIERFEAHINGKGNGK